MMKSSNKRVLVVGAGLSGSEAAYFLATHGVSVVLCECKGLQKNMAQRSDFFAELVCTNSLKSMSPVSAHGILKAEMERLSSLVLSCAKETAVPAGEALAVDRELFSQKVTGKLREHPLIEIVEKEVINPLEAALEFSCDYTIVAAGPLSCEKLTKWIFDHMGQQDCYFYDAIAPIVDADSLDYDIIYGKDRNREEEIQTGEAAYLNAPFSKDEYLAFVEAISKAEKVVPKEFEKQTFFESCLPIDVMVERGVHTARFSCMKPRGLFNPREGREPYAVVQLRRENLLGDAYNLVGFQTRLTFPEQKRVFRMIPGFEKAEFLHYGSVHRNTFLNAKNVLEFDMRSKLFPNLYFAGQITGVEGYTESSMSGLYVAYQLLCRLRGEEVRVWPSEMAFGALINYLMTTPKAIPSNVHLGLFPPVEIPEGIKRGGDVKKYKKAQVSERAKSVADNFFL